MGAAIPLQDALALCQKAKIFGDETKQIQPRLMYYNKKSYDELYRKPKKYLLQNLIF